MGMPDYTSVGQIGLDLIVNKKGFNKDINSMASYAKGTLSKAFSGVGKILGVALAGAGIASFISDCISLGSNLQEVQNVVDVTFGDMSGKVNAFAQSAITSAGLSETAAKQMMGQFGAMSTALGFSQQEAYDMSAALTQLSGDVASFYNLSGDEAFNKLKSVFTGETESLRSLGVVMTQTSLDAYAMENGWNKTTAAMTEAEKTSLRFAFVTDRLSAASGDFIRTSDGWANQVRVLTLQFESFKATMGQGFINLFTPIIQMINVLLSKLMTLSQYFVAFTKLITGKNGAAESTVSNMSKAASSATSLKKGLDGVGKSAQKAAKATGALAAFDDLNILSSGSAARSGGGSGGGSSASAMPALDFGGLGAGTVDTSGVDEIYEKVKATFDKIVSFLTENKATILGVIGGIVGGFTAFSVIAGGPVKACTLIGTAFTTVFDAIKGGEGIMVGLKTAFMGLTAPMVAIVAGVALVTGALVYLWNTNEGFRANVQKAWDNICKLLQTVYDEFIQPILDNVVALFKNVWENGIKPLWDNFVEFVDAASQLVLDIWNAIAPILDNVLHVLGPIFSEVLSGLTTAFGDTFNAVLGFVSDTIDAITPVLEGLRVVLEGIIDFITGVFTGDWSKAWEGVKKIFKGIWDSLSGLVKGAWDTILGLFSNTGKIFKGIVDSIASVFKKIINSVIDGINKVIRTPFNKVNGLLNTIKDVSIFGMKPFYGFWGYNPLPVPQIPKLAEGGYVAANTPQLAMIGDNRHQGEIVAPEGKMYEVMMQVLKDYIDTSRRGNDESLNVFIGVLYEILDAIKNLRATIDPDGIVKIYDARKRQITLMAGR